MLQSVKTALSVFETIARKEPIGVSDIARYLNISKSTAQRCVSVLHETGWIKIDEHKASTKWMITSKAFILGQRVTQRGRLRDIAMPFMEKLWEALNESIHLAVAEGDKAIVLEQYETPSPMGAQLPRGAWAPMHLVASGKVLLSHSTKEFIDQYLQKDLPAITPHTISDPARLREELEKIRNQGWAVAIDELVVGASAAAAPIFGWDGHIVAALAITLPTVNFKASLRGNYISLLVDAAEEISTRLQAS